MIKKFETKKGIAGLFAGVYLFSAIIAFIIFSLIGGSESAITGAQLASIRDRIKEAPKTEVCPINGAMHTEIERDIWETRRPMGVMIENHPDARPLSGLSRADVVYEAVAEGGVTRFMGIYYCDAAAQDVRMSPIRSARVYFIDWIAEYGDHPLYIHFGGANNYCNYDQDQENCQEDYTKLPGLIDSRVMAVERLVDMGWRHSKGNALDGGTNASIDAASGKEYIIRDLYRLGGDTPAEYEHSPLGYSDSLFELGIKNGFGGNGWERNYSPWKFADPSPLATAKVTNIELEFWPNKPDFDVVWDYDAETNLYLRSNGGVPHLDFEFNKPQLSASNVVIMFLEEETEIDDEKHVYYHTIGDGEAIIFQNGDMIEGSWEKSSQFARTMFYDGTGREIEFVRGKIWIEGVPLGNDILTE